VNPESQEQNTVNIEVSFPAQPKWRDYGKPIIPQHKLLTLAFSCGKLKI
jgi:hypothetical protein